MAISALTALVLTTTAAQAQSVTFGAGGGVTIPTGDFKSAAKLGWIGQAHIGYGLASGLGIRGEFLYGQNSAKSGLCPSGVSCKTKLAGGLGSLSYDFSGAGSVKPYVLGSVGVFNVKAEASGPGGSASVSETKVAFGGGAGLKFKAGTNSSVYLESRYVSVSTSGGSTGFIPITLGFTFGAK
jgi:opacity protein-like surface antigen